MNGNRQTQKMKQQLKLTPQQMMLMRLLQLPLPELEQSIRDEIERNPMLEESAAKNDKEEPLLNDDEVLETENDDYDYRERLEKDKNIEQREHFFMSDMSSADLLMEQLSFKHLSERQKTICQEIIGDIDETGYLRRDIGLISNDLAFRQGVEASFDEIEKALAIVQSLDPAGIGARNLQECLSLQLHRLDDDSEAVVLATAIVDNDFESFSNRNYDRIKRRYELEDEDLQKAIDTIRRLDPKPGNNISLELPNRKEGGAPSVQPDFTISFHNGELSLRQNDFTLPQLHLNHEYEQMLAELQGNTEKDRSEQDAFRFLKEKSENAHLFIDTLNQRHKTLQQIVAYIVERQKAFFVSGDVNDIKPLQQKDIAEATGFDSSTISRVVSSKYLETDFGIIPLKDCFSKSITTDSGETIATKQIKEALRELVEHEDKRNPLSDEDLAAELNKAGFPVARRTVAKYREQLGIAVGRLRRNLQFFIGIVLTLLLLLPNRWNTTAYAQTPSYYDSIINAQLHKDKPKKTPQQSEKKTKQNTTTIDSTLLKGDDLIDIIYDQNIPDCARMWYGNHFSHSRVRERLYSLDSLPDEINIKLVKNAEDFCFPVKNVITSPYGWRWERAHRGVDIRLNVGTPVHSAFAGVVRIARPMGAYGNLVVIRHYNGLETVYGHLSKINVKEMQRVEAGSVIGLGGSTGHSTGPHLHFEVRFEYETFDPEWILDFSNYTLRTRKLHLDKSYFGVFKPRSKNDVVYKADKSFIKETTVQKGPRYYTAQKDDYSELIALKFGITVEMLRTLNPGLKKVKEGMRLRVR